MNQAEKPNFCKSLLTDNLLKTNYPFDQVSFFTLLEDFYRLFFHLKLIFLKFNLCVTKEKGFAAKEKLKLESFEELRTDSMLSSAQIKPISSPISHNCSV